MKLKVSGLGQIKNNQFVKSSLGLVAITLLIKAAGYIEKLVLAYYFGTSYETDAYVVVMTVVLSSFFVFREIIEPGFLNTFLRLRTEKEEGKEWGFFYRVTKLILVIICILTIPVLIFPEGTIAIFAPGFDEQTHDLASTLIQIAFPASIFLSLSTLTNITLNGLKRFTLPASADIIFKGFIIICLIIFFNVWGIYGAAIGILLGAIGKLSMHTLILRNYVKKVKKCENSHLLSMWSLTWPLIIGVILSQISSLLDNVFGSYLQEGTISALSYSKKIIELPVLLFPYVLSIVAFPYLTQLSIETDHHKLKGLFGSSLLLIFLSFLPLSFFFLLFSNEIVQVILERGAFDTFSTSLTAKPLEVFSLGLIFISIETILVIFYYSTGDTKTPILVGSICVVVNIILTYVLVQWIGYLGIAIAFVVQKTLKNLILLHLLNHKISFKRSAIWSPVWKAGVSVIPCLISMIILREGFLYKIEVGVILKLLSLGAIFVISGAIYLLMLRLFKMKLKLSPL